LFFAYTNNLVFLSLFISSKLLSGFFKLSIIELEPSFARIISFVVKFRFFVVKKVF